MEEKISPQFQIHGVALEKCGVGILLLGEAGSGKSSVALTLLKRGARLIADDAVMIRKDREGRLAAKPHPQVRGSLHVRHKGLIRVAEVFGAKALSDSCFIDICFRLNDFCVDRISFFDYDIPGSLGIAMRRLPVAATRKRRLEGTADSVEESVWEFCHSGTASNII